METHVAASGANVHEISSARSTLIRKGIGCTSAIAIAFVSSLILTFTARAHDPSHQYTEWSKKQRNQGGYVCCDGSDAHYLGSDMSGCVSNPTTVSALKAFGST